MKHRNIMAVIFYSILTFGIYDLVWLVKVKKELNQKTSIKTPTIWLLFAPVLALVVMVAVMMVMASVTSSEGARTAANIVALLVYLVAFLGIVPLTFYWFFKFSKAVHEYTKGDMNTAVTFLLLWMLRFIGIAVIQDKFNDMLAAGPTGAVPVYQSAAAMPPAAGVPQDGQGNGQHTPPANPIG